MKKKIIFIFLCSLFLFINSGVVFSIDTSDTGYNIGAGVTKYIKSTTDSKEGMVNNKCSSSIFVPTKNAGEFNSFNLNKPCSSLYYESAWSSGSWSACSVSCGSGTQTRSVVCKANSVTYSDSYCSLKSKPSTSTSCDAGSSTCGWSAWSNSGSCSKNCNTGQQMQVRTCNVAGHCTGSATQYINCNTQSCCSTKTHYFDRTTSTSPTIYKIASGNEYISGTPYMSGYTAYATVCIPETNDASCSLDGVIVSSGSGRTFYSTTTTTGSCSSYSQYRTCTNGVLSGSSTYRYSSCIVDGGTCFEGNEEVLTINGEVPIKNIKVGDIVISFDENSQEFTNSVVGEIIVHDGIQNPINNYERDNLIELIVDVNGVETRTEVTDNHLYYNPKAGNYKQIGDFNVGDEVLSINGIGIIKSMNVLIDENSSEEKQKTIVYNLHMKSGPANYLVDGIIVHNIKLEPDCDPRIEDCDLLLR